MTQHNHSVAKNRNGYVTSMPLKEWSLSCPTKYARHLALTNLNGDIIFKLLYLAPICL